MARVSEFDQLESAQRAAGRAQHTIPDPSVDETLQEFLDRVQGPQQYYNNRNAPRPFDPSKIMTDQRLPPAIGAPMASSGAPPPPRETAPPLQQMAQGQLYPGLPRAATQVPPGLPDPSGRSPAAQSLGAAGVQLGGPPVGGPPVGGPPVGGPSARAPVSQGLELPPGMTWADEMPKTAPGTGSGQESIIQQGIKANAQVGAAVAYGARKIGEALGSVAGRVGEAPTPSPQEAQAAQIGGANRALKGDSAAPAPVGISPAMAPHLNSMQEVTQRLGRSPVDLLPYDVAAKGVESAGNAAALARWSRAYERAFTDGDHYSIAALAVATKSLNSNLGSDINPKDLIMGIRSERASPPPTAGMPASEVAAVSGAPEAAAAREVAAARLAQGARGTARAQSPGMDRPGKSQELLDALTRIVRVPGDILQGRYPYTAGMSAADYTDQPGAMAPQAQLAIPAMYMAADTLGASMPFKGLTAQPVTRGPQLALPPPMKALPAPTRELPPGFMEQLQQTLQAPTAGPVRTLSDLAAARTPLGPSDYLPTAPPSRRRSGGHFNRRMGETPPLATGDMQKLFEAGWTVDANGRLIPPGPGGR